VSPTNVPGGETPLARSGASFELSGKQRLEHFLCACIAESAPEIAVAASENHKAQVGLLGGAALLASVDSWRRVEREIW